MTTVDKELDVVDTDFKSVSEQDKDIMIDCEPYFQRRLKGITHVTWQMSPISTTVHTSLFKLLGEDCKRRKYWHWLNILAAPSRVPEAIQHIDIILIAAYVAAGSDPASRYLSYLHALVKPLAFFLHPQQVP